MSPHARALLRRIALGLPLVTIGCGTPNDYCARPTGTSTHQVTTAQLEQARNAFGSPTGCETVCREFDVFSVPPEAGIDAGMEDGGLFGVAYYARVVCSEPDGGASLLTCTYYPTCIGGRAPAGLLVPRAFGDHAAAWLARAAHLEAASVAAFEDLARELAGHGSPRQLVHAAARAAEDERRHADAVTKLAVARGARVPTVERSATASRSLRALAESNAIEGCVRETYGALVATMTASHAVDADVRDAYVGIAPDEARHALLSSAIHDWASTRLSSQDASSIERSRRAELSAWRAAEMEDDATRLALGLPDRATRAALLDVLA